MPIKVPPGVTGGARRRRRGKFGCRAPTPADTPRLWLCHYFQARGKQAIQPPPPATNRREAIQDWKMLDNSRYGDCCLAELGHLYMLFTHYGEGRQQIPTDAEILEAYRAACGAGDNGCFVLDVLDYWRRPGFRGDKLLAYAGIHCADPMEVKVCVHEFGGVYAACSLPGSALEEFDAGLDWTRTNENGNPRYGHCIPIVDYDAEWCYLVTWGEVVRASWAWVQRYLGAGDGEGWCLIDAAWTARNPTPSGIDLDTLYADFEELTGDDPPAPPDPPTPPPAPTPVITCFLEFLESVFSGASIAQAFGAFAACLFARGAIDRAVNRRAQALAIDARFSRSAAPWAACLPTLFLAIFSGVPIGEALIAFITCMLSGGDPSNPRP